MGYAELIEKLQALPLEKQVEVCDFVEFLAVQSRKSGIVPVGDQDRDNWTNAAFTGFSMAQALRGMEDDPVTYTTDDLRERWQ